MEEKVNRYCELARERREIKRYLQDHPTLSRNDLAEYYPEENYEEYRAKVREHYARLQAVNEELNSLSGSIMKVVEANPTPENIALVKRMRAAD